MRAEALLADVVERSAGADRAAKPGANDRQHLESLHVDALWLVTEIRSWRGAPPADARLRVVLEQLYALSCGVLALRPEVAGPQDGAGEVVATDRQPRSVAER